MTALSTHFDTVLLVDDSEATNAMNVYLLQRLNAARHIEVALNGADALAYLQAKAGSPPKHPCPDLIILDLNMPVMNGTEFLKHYQKLDEGQKGGIVLIMLTTSMLEKDRQQVNEIGVVSEYLSKPLTLEMVQKIIDKYGRS